MQRSMMARVALIGEFPIRGRGDVLKMVGW